MGEIDAEGRALLDSGRRFGGRLLVASAAIYVGALLGVVQVDRLGTWDVDPVIPYAALLTLMFGSPFAILVASAPLRRTALAVVAAAAGATFFATTLAFGNSERSTAGLVFAWWWVAGIPIALAIMLVSRRFDGPEDVPHR